MKFDEFMMMNLRKKKGFLLKEGKKGLGIIQNFIFKKVFLMKEIIKIL